MYRPIAPAALVSLCCFLAALSAAVQAMPTPVPELVPPPGATLVREVQGGGSQIYVCRLTSGTFAWNLLGPKALLVNDDGSDFGTHGAGPTWTATDGSSVVADGAHPLAKSERPDSVPALLLAVKEAHGTGILASTRLVRRSDTRGGLPPETGCDAAHEGTTIARHYSAVYTFYQ